MERSQRCVGEREERPDAEKPRGGAKQPARRGTGAAERDRHASELGVLVRWSGRRSSVEAREEPRDGTDADGRGAAEVRELGGS